MSGRTIAGSYASGVTLTSATDNPVSIATGSTVASTTGAALQGDAGTYWTIGNAGTIQANGTGAGNPGVLLAGADAVSNTPAGVIAGFDLGVSITGSGTVVNAGHIGASGTTGSPGYSYNGATHVLTPLTGGVVMGGGGVDNAASAVIAGYFEGVALGGNGVVANAGTISAGAHGFAVVLPEGGTVGNVAGGTISAGRYGILTLGTNPASVTNLGLIASQNLIGIDLGSGGEIDNAGGTVTGATYGIVANGAPSTVDNQGLVIGQSIAGVGLFSGGTLSNSGTGEILSGNYGVVAAYSAATVVNAATIVGYGQAGVGLLHGGVVTNADGGEIGGGVYGIVARNLTASVVNLGTVAAQSVAGVGLLDGGSVSNATTGRISGSHYGVAATGGAATVANQGIVAGTLGSGVLFLDGGYVSNAAAGTITGEYFGIRVSAADGSVTNYGSVSSSATFAGVGGFDAAGVDLAHGGTVLNGMSGNIRATWKGVELGNISAAVGGTLLNQGMIYASNSAGNTGAAVWIHGPGLISNAASGIIAGGPFGVVSYYQTTVVNFGTIFGSEYAIDANHPGYANRVIVGPGAVFSGIVDGGNTLGATVSSVLELANGTAAGTIAGFGSKYVGFGQVIIDSGATWSLGGTLASAQTLSFAGSRDTLTLGNPIAMAGTISGFGASDMLVLGGIGDVTGTHLDINNRLTISESTGPGLTLQFDPAQNLSGMTFQYATVAGGTDLTVACFAAGTGIMTEHGRLPVQALRPGIRVHALFGGMVPVVWVGHRRIDCRRHTRPQDVWPVRVCAGAFGPAQPEVDLYLSPDHAVFVQDVLIPVRHLIDGDSIRQVPRDTVEYYHVELAQHDVLLAEGLPAESYLDVGDRARFANGGGVVRLFPDFAGPALDLCTMWEAHGCAPLVVRGPVLEAARRHIAAVAAALPAAGEVAA